MPDAAKKWHEAETVLEVTTKIEYNAAKLLRHWYGISYIYLTYNTLAGGVNVCI